MSKWRQWFTKKDKVDLQQHRDEKIELIHEIHKAHLEWTTAQLRFEFVVEREQIDYAVYALEAAEKRYEMLIRQAKRINMTTSDVCMERARALEASGS
jgi:hypothetical protein